MNFEVYLTVIMTTLAVFSYLNEVAKEESKEKIEAWLQNLKTARKNQNWANQFNEVFESIFTKSHFNWRCLFRSCIASFLAIIILTLVWYFVSKEEFFNFIESSEFTERFLLLILGILTVNFVADYISLFVTRFMVKFLGSKYSAKRMWFVLIADLILTYLVLMVITIVYFKLFYFPHLVDWIPPHGIIKYVFDGENAKKTLTMHVIEQGWFSTGILFYSTFFTSIWLWIYVAAGFFIKGIYFLKRKFAITTERLIMKKKPILFIGMYAIVIETVIYLILRFI